MRGAWLWLLLGALAAVLVLGLLRDDDSAPEVNPDAVRAVVESRRAVMRAEAERDSVVAELAETVAALEAERAALSMRADEAMRDGERIAARLADRYGADSVAARELRGLRAAHRREVLAERETARTWEAEALALRTARETDARLIVALTDQVARHEALDAERVRVNEGLRGALARERTKGRITLAVAGVGLAILALR